MSFIGRKGLSSASLSGRVAMNKDAPQGLPTAMSGYQLPLSVTWNHNLIFFFLLSTHL